jgi:hypothetical protein
MSSITIITTTMNHMAGALVDAVLRQDVAFDRLSGDGAI